MCAESGPVGFRRKSKAQERPKGVSGVQREHGGQIPLHFYTCKYSVVAKDIGEALERER